MQMSFFKLSDKRFSDLKIGFFTCVIFVLFFITSNDSFKKQHFQELPMILPTIVICLQLTVRWYTLSTIWFNKFGVISYVFADSTQLFHCGLVEGTSGKCIWEFVIIDYSTLKKRDLTIRIQMNLRNSLCGAFQLLLLIM